MNETASKPLDTSMVKPAWIVIIVGWVIILLPIPFTTPLGWIVAGLVGSALAIVNIVRGITVVGIVQLACALAGTWLMSLIGWAIFGASVVGAALSTT